MFSDIKFASNIVFSNGNLDPWRGGGVSVNTFTTLYNKIGQEMAHRCSTYLIFTQCVISESIGLHLVKISECMSV